jgi:hypothetical protein
VIQIIIPGEGDMELVFGGLLTLWDHPGVIALALSVCVIAIMYRWIANADLNSLSKISNALLRPRRKSNSSKTQSTLSFTKSSRTKAHSQR